MYSLYSFSVFPSSIQGFFSQYVSFKFPPLSCILFRHRLLSAVLRTSEVESRATRASLTQLLSPQMGKDIVWFLRRWAKTYLLVDEKLYEQVWNSAPHIITLIGFLAHYVPSYPLTVSTQWDINQIILPSYLLLSSDQHPPEHSVWSRNRRGPVDCGVSPGEGHQQSVCVELGGWAVKWHCGPAGDACREEGEVSSVLQQLRWLATN